ncbi:hypothetical protein F5Y04DRAFT_292087 [Hypomontagnella monticulosa]|nr:hypothetical protein F5Y04DRAFT_292087 [Hypomontagnella monticulosa]
MRVSIPLTILSVVASGTAVSDPPPQLPAVSSISSSIPFQCSPGKSIGVTLRPNRITTDLSEMQFWTEGHGRTEEYASCDFRVELNSWYYKYRVAIASAAVRGHANLTEGVKIFQFNTTAIFRLQHLKNFSPITPPEVTNLSLSYMLNELTPASIGGDDSFDDDFEVGVKSSTPLVWSPCFNGGEGGGQDSTYIDFLVSASSSDKTGEGTGVLTSGLSIDWDLVWEECTPNSDERNSWGDIRIENWQSCTYTSANNQTYQRKK